MYLILQCSKVSVNWGCLEPKTKAWTLVCHLLAVWPWESCSASPSLWIPTFKRQIVRTFTYKCHIYNMTVVSVKWDHPCKAVSPGPATRLAVISEGNWILGAGWDSHRAFGQNWVKVRTQAQACSLLGQGFGIFIISKENSTQQQLPGVV